MALFNLSGKIKFLLFDLHGVVLPSEGTTGTDRAFSALKADLQKAEKLGLMCGVISASEDISLLQKVKDLGLKEVFSHSIDKVSQAEILLKKYNLGYENIGFVGDDILDIPLLMKSGFSAAPRGARREVKRIVNYVTKDSEEKTVLSDVLDMISKAREQQANESK
ncbi:MAG: HAD hydrolase family protein [Acidobacteriota bacterium]